MSVASPYMSVCSRYDLAGMRDGYRGRVERVHITQSVAIMVVLAVVVIVGTLASRRDAMGAPFHRRPAAIVFALVLVLIAGMCLFLATRHGP